MSIRLVLDAGPLYALAAPKDTAHEQAKLGFVQLAKESAELIVPLPIIFEVFKLLAYRDSPRVARAVLEQMMSMNVIPIGLDDVKAISIVLDKIPRWGGSLEDASAILIAQRFKCLVWTLNYRDFGSFQDLQFWNPHHSTQS
jgi:predicted nucleic acid-binding protein